MPYACQMGTISCSLQSLHMFPRPRSFTSSGPPVKVLCRVCHSSVSEMSCTTPTKERSWQTREVRGNLEAADCTTSLVPLSSVQFGIGNNRDGRDGGYGKSDRYFIAIESPRNSFGHRRLWHGVFVVELSASPPVRHIED